ncbi:YDG domain-containing protein [Desertivirga xinjiangensis]|uniref:YDG domain-containing protein n=1 Tax=Desertivirga xinjiangensis TaxID=539206 RepID=UPI00210A0424|nr:YDG domain-containing protein [Pedobacter xinjiangensis]
MSYLYNYLIRKKWCNSSSVSNKATTGTSKARKQSFALILALLVLNVFALSYSSKAQTTVINFNNKNFGENVTYGSKIYQEGNIKITYSAANWFEDNNSGAGGSAALFAGAYTYATETVTIETVDGSELDFQSFWAHNYGTVYTSLEGFRNGTSTGTQTTGLPAQNTNGIVSLTNSVFDNVDKLVFTSSSGFFDLFDDLTFGPPVTSPAAPTLSAATSISATGFTVNWGAVTGASSYRLDVSTSSTFATASLVAGFENKEITGGSTTSQAVTGLSAGTTYYYRVRAVNSGGTSDNSTAGNQVTVTAAPAVTLNQGDLFFTEIDLINKEFRFVTLAEIPAGSEIYFTDRGWTGSKFVIPTSSTATAGEGTFKWVPVAKVPAGTVFKVKITGSGNTSVKGSVTLTNQTTNQNKSSEVVVVGGYSATLADWSASLPFVISGEQLFFYQGSSVSPVFITGFNNTLSAPAPSYWDTSISDNTLYQSVLPSSLAVGNSVSMIHDANKGDFYTYTGPTTKVDRAAWLARLSNRANYGGSNTSGSPTTAIGTSILIGTETAPAAPTITFFSPASGPVGTTVSITGTNFNTTAANNIVYFGATKATVTFATATSLTVTVPGGASYQPITVLNTASSLVAQSTKPFNPTFVMASGNSFPATSYGFVNGSEVAIIDLNGDGKPDIASANATGANGVGGYLNAFTNNTSSAISFSAANTFSSGDNPTSAAYADFNGDGKMDFVLANNSGGSVSVFENNTSGATISFKAQLNLNLGTIPEVARVADLDGDGKIDIVVTTPWDNSVSIFKNTSSGGVTSFAAKETYSTGSCTNVAVADFDNDGKIDMAVLRNDPSRRILLIKNNSTPGSFSFSSSSQAIDILYPRNIAVADFNTDGKTDIAIGFEEDGSGLSKQIQIFKNTSSIGLNFEPQAAISLPTGAGMLAQGDLDGDGKPDLAIASNYNYSALALRNNTSGSTISFAIKEIKAATTTGDSQFGDVASVAIGDVDADGKADVVMTSGYDDKLYVLKNNLDFYDPAIPSGLSVTAGNARNDLSWTANTESDLKEYRLYSGTSTNPTTLLATITKPTVTYSHTGLTNNTTYYYKITAVDNAGNESAKSAEVTRKPIAPAVTPPGKPDRPSPSLVTSNSFKLNWTPVKNAASYQLDVSTSKDFSTFISGYSSKSITGLTEELTGLTPGTFYYFRLRAVNDGGAGDNSLLNTQRTHLAGTTVYTFNEGTNAGSGENWTWTEPGKTHPLTLKITGSKEGEVYGGGFDLGSSVEYAISNSGVNGASLVATISIPGYTFDLKSLKIADGTSNWEPLPLATYSFTTSKGGELSGELPYAVAPNDYVTLIGSGSAYESLSFIKITFNDGDMPFLYLEDLEINNIRVAITAPIATTTAVATKTSTTATLPGAVSDGGAETTITFEYGTNADLSGAASVNASPDKIAAGAGSTNVSAAITGLIGGTTYYYRVKAVNTAGTTTGDIKSFVTDLAIPSAPTLSAATSVTDNSLTINWAAVSGADSYKLDVSVYSDFKSHVSGYYDKTIISTSEVLSGLNPGTTYYYKVRAVNTSGTSTNSTTGSQITIPAAPNLYATNEVNPGGFTLHWGSNGATSFRLDIATSNDFAPGALLSGYTNKEVTLGTSLTVTGLAEGTTYYYRIRAVNAGGTSPNSAVGSQITPLAASAISFKDSYEQDPVTFYSWEMADGRHIYVGGPGFDGGYYELKFNQVENRWEIGIAGDEEILYYNTNPTSLIPPSFTYSSITSGGWESAGENDEKLEVLSGNVTNGEVALAASPTLKFSNSDGFTDHIANDGDGGSMVIKDLNLQVRPVNSSGVTLTEKQLKLHDNTQLNWESYPPIIVYGGSDMASFYGWSIKSNNGDNFSLESVDFHDWGSREGDVFKIEAFEGGEPKGSLDFNGNKTSHYVGLSQASSELSLTLPAVFKNVDEVRIYKKDGVDSYIALNNIKVGTPLSSTAVSSIARKSSINPTNATTVEYTVTFAADVTGVDAGDFELTKTGTADGSVGTPDGSGKVWTVPVTSVKGAGTLRLDFVGTSGVTPNVSESFTKGEEYTVDHVAPALVIKSDKSKLKTDETAVITFTFDEDPGMTFTDTDVSVSGGILGAMSGSGVTRTATFTPDANIDNGTASITVAEAAYTDAVGNPGTAGLLPSLTFDTKAPAAPVVVALADGTYTNDNDPTFTGTAEPGSIVKIYVNDVLRTPTKTADGSGNWTITPLGAYLDGANTVKATASDEAGNTSPESNTNTFYIDAVAPKVTSIKRQTPSSEKTNADELTFRVTFSEKLSGVKTEHFSVSGTTASVGALQEITEGTVFDLPVSGGNLASLDGEVSLSISSVSGIKDIAGNVLSSFTPTDANEKYTIDNTAPVITGVAEGEVYTSDRAISFNEGKGQLGTETFTSGSTLSTEGPHSLVVTDAAGNSTTVKFIIDKTAPLTPANFVLTTKDKAIKLNWDANSEGDLAGYKVYWGTASNSLNELADKTALELSHEHLSLNNGTTYYYTIKAYDKAGNESVASAVKSGTPKSGQVITFNPLTAVTYGDGSFDLSATSTSGLEVEYISDNKDVATVSGKTVNIIGAGSAKIIAKQTGSEAYSAADEVEQTLEVKKKEIAGSFKAKNKVYDGTKDATITDRSVTPLAADAGKLELAGGTATFADANAETAKTVTATGMSLSGEAAGNYTLTGVNTTTADITALEIAGSFKAKNKVYDGTNGATITDRSVTPLAADAGKLELTGGTASFDNANVSTAKTVTATGMSLSGEAAGNYTLTGVNTTTADITALEIAGSFKAKNKVYDGTNGATITDRSVTPLAADAGKLELTGGTASFDNANVSTAKTVTATGMSLSGEAAGNYSLTGVNTTTADITALEIAGSFKAKNKVYDGTKEATITDRSVTPLPADAGKLELTGGTATFDDASVSTAKAVTATGMSLSGVAAGNYTLTGVNTTTADITVLEIAGSFTADNKVYDGTADATILTRKVTPLDADKDKLSLTGGTAVFDNASAGTGKKVTAQGMSLSGEAAANYSLKEVTNTTADITAKEITGSFTAENKVYDGTDAATILTRTVTPLSTDEGKLELTAGTATFNNAHAGTGKTVTATGMSLSGDAAANYTLKSVNATTADITALEITGSFTAANKVYDGTAAATILTRTLIPVAGDENKLSLTGGTASFDNANAGTARTVTATGMSLSGDAATNYTLKSVNTTTASITAKEVVGSFTADNKVYDATAAATILTRTVTPVAGDENKLSLNGGTASFDNVHAGTGKTVTATGMTLNGAAAGNYTLKSVSTTTANITVKEIAGSFTADNKVYDGTDAATILTRTVTAVAGDENKLSLTGGTATFANANAGTGKTVTATGMTLSGSAAANYVLTGVGTTTANITAKVITASASPVTKVYDGTTNAVINFNTFTTADGKVGSDDVAVDYAAAAYDSKNVGTAKGIHITGLALKGSAKDNYSLNTFSTTGAITKAPLTITAENKEKFQGLPLPSFTAAFSGFVNNETAAVLNTQPGFSTTADAMSAAGPYPIVVSGATAGNYEITHVDGVLTVKPGFPTSITLVAATVYENAASGTLAGTLSSTSDDPTTTFKYELVAGTGDTDNGLFEIASESNEIRTKAGLNYENKPSYQVRVRSIAQNSQLHLDKEFTIAISNVNEAPTIDALANSAICYTEAQQTVELSNITPGPDANQTTIVSVSSSNNSLFESLTVTQADHNRAAQLRYRLAPNASGTAVLTVLIQDNGGTANGGVDLKTQSFTLTINQLPVIAISSDKGTTLSKGEIAVLKADVSVANNGLIYSWADANGIISVARNEATLNVRPSETTTYTLTVTNANGCVSTQSITIEVLADFKVVDGTNIITPNGDDVNDNFVIRNIDMYPNNVVKIFDRAGRLLYSKNNYSNEFNGTFQGSPLAEDTYYYVVDFGPGKERIKGFITIVRD